VTRTVPAVADVLAISTNVCVRASRRLSVGQHPPRGGRRRAGGVVRFGPEVGVTAGPGNHIERSTTIGTALVDVIAHDSVG
jgi:hypothetical protein